MSGRRAWSPSNTVVDQNYLCKTGSTPACTLTARHHVDRMAQIRVAGQRMTGRFLAPAHESTSERESAGRRRRERCYRESDERREADPDRGRRRGRASRDAHARAARDIEMPGLDGVAALRQIPALAARVPVIMVTGNESTRVAGDVIGLGAFSYLPKPVRFDYLRHIASSILG